MSKTPENLGYTESHEWVLVKGDEATIGITDHAQAALNDIVYIELPKKGTKLPLGKEFGVVESVKSVSDLYMPVSGEIIAVNGELEDEPEAMNEDPYGKGWIIKVRMSDPSEAKKLLTAKAYAASVA